MSERRECARIPDRDAIPHHLAWIEPNNRRAAIEWTLDEHTRLRTIVVGTVTLVRTCQVRSFASTIAARVQSAAGSTPAGSE